MALEPEQYTFLRQLVSEPDDSQGWTTERIDQLGPGALLPDGTYDLRLYAALIWEAKAADAAEMVSVSESGSSRSMNQVFDHSLEMAKRYRAPAPSVPGGADPPLPPRSTRIVRPTRA